MSGNKPANPVKKPAGISNEELESGKAKAPSEKLSSHISGKKSSEEKPEGHITELDRSGHYCDLTGTEGGKCLWGDFGEFRKNTSCSYRWQAWMKAHEMKYFYNDRSNALIARIKATNGLFKVKSSRYKGKNQGEGEFVPALYGKYVNLPEEIDDWGIGGPNRNIPVSFGKNKKGEDIKLYSNTKDGEKKFVPSDTIKKGKNFTSDRWPYWNNCHHLISQALLVTSIEKATTEKPSIRTLVQGGLLKAEYNVNHMKNMLILPMDKVVAKLLHFPRHLGLDIPDFRYDGNSKFDHKMYTALVETKLKVIMDDYVKDIPPPEGEKKDHPIPDATITKKKLVDLSEELWDILILQGHWDPGTPIDAAGAGDYLSEIQPKGDPQ